MLVGVVVTLDETRAVKGREIFGVFLGT